MLRAKIFRRVANWSGFRRLALVLPALLVGAVLTGAVQAQSWDDRDAFFGTGTLRYEGRSVEMERAGIRRNGDTINIRLRAITGEVHVLDGRVSRTVPDGYDAQITALDGDDAAGLLFVGSRGSLQTRRIVQKAKYRTQLSVSFQADERVAGNAKPNYPQLTLSDRGYGSLIIQGRRSIEIDRVSVTTRRDGKGDIVVSGPNGRNMQFGANVVRSDRDTISLRLASSGQADATGSATLRFSRNRLESFAATGTMDGQKLAIHFQRDTGTAESVPTDLVLSQRGSGILDIHGNSRSRLTAAGASIRRNGTADITLTRANGTVFNLAGRVAHRDAYNVRIAIRSSGEADATGTATITYGARGSIRSLSIDGIIDGQGMSVYFAP